MTDVIFYFIKSWAYHFGRTSIKEETNPLIIAEFANIPRID